MPRINIDGIPLAKNEPKMHSLLKGFVAPPSVAMRLAPEVLLLELFREVFFQGDDDMRASTLELSPDAITDTGHHLFTDGERAAIHSLKGRRKQTKKVAKESIFYAPAYPKIARGGWLSKNRERIVGKLLFEGAFPQWLWWQGGDSDSANELQRSAVETAVRALAGNDKESTGQREGGLIQDILAAASNAQLDEQTFQSACQVLTNATGRDDQIIKGGADELSDRLCLDFIELCRAEKELPRLLWLRLVMTFLRFALPMWFLARLESTVLLREAVAESLEGRPPQNAEALRDRFLARNRFLLAPSITRSRLLYDKVAKYIRCRVELNALMHLIEQLRPEEISGKKLVLHQASRGQIAVSDFLRLVSQIANELRAAEVVNSAPDVEAFFTRIGERYPAWRNPRANGQGKNINEFLMVLYKAETGDEEGGHLLIREGRGDSAGFRAFPGPLLLQLVAFLAFRSKSSGGSILGGGTGLNLRDIEDHFKIYGINFSAAAETRPLLLKELQNLGLLVGSPDAGSSVGVKVPFLR
jgi:hypothetical protein